MKKLIFSTVLYNTPIKDIKNLIDSIESLSIAFKEKNKCKSHKIIDIDNSKNPKYFIDDLLTGIYSFKIDLVRSNRNLGYGLGHNNNLLDQKSK